MLPVARLTSSAKAWRSHGGVSRTTSADSPRRTLKSYGASLSSLCAFNHLKFPQFPWNRHSNIFCYLDGSRSASSSASHALNGPNNTRSFCTSLQLLQSASTLPPRLTSNLNGLQQESTGLYKDTSRAHRAKIETVDRFIIDELLGESPALGGARPKPPVLQHAPKNAIYYVNARSAAVNTKEGITTSNKDLEKLAVGAAACADYTRLWKVLDQVQKGQDKPFSLDSYRDIVQALLTTDSRVRSRANQLWTIFQYHIRALPNYLTEQMFPLALYFVNALSVDRPVQALRVYVEVMKEFGGLASHTVESTILELELASKLPYIDTLCLYVENARNMANQIQNETERQSAHARIALALIQGLITANHPETALEVLLSSHPFDPAVQSSIDSFLQGYRAIVSALAKKDIKSVENALSILNSLPKQMAKAIKHEERYQWILKAHAYANTGRMSDAAAIKRLDNMSLVSGVTADACNSYLEIVSKNAQPSSQKAAIEAQIEMLFKKYAFLPDGATFCLLARSSQTLKDVMGVFDRACQTGHADSDVYGEFFRKLGNLTVVREISSESGNMAVGTLIEQFQESGLCWTPKLLEGMLQTLTNLGFYRQALDLFDANVKRGEIRINSNCANAALQAAQKLGGAHSQLSLDISATLERNLDRLDPFETPAGVDLNAALSSVTYRDLKRPNSETSLLIAASKPKIVDLSLKTLVNTQPWMTLNRKGYNLVSLHNGYRAELHAKVTSPPHGIVPSLPTYRVMMRSSKRLARWDDMTFLLLEMLHHYPHSVSDEIIDEVMMAIASDKQVDCLDSLRVLLQPHGIQIPEPQEVMRRFQQSL